MYVDLRREMLENDGIPLPNIEEEELIGPVIRDLRNLKHSTPVVGAGSTKCEIQASCWEVTLLYHLLITSSLSFCRSNVNCFPW